MSSQWYYARNQQRMGPVSSSELKSLAATGQLLPTDLVFKEGHQKWIPASAVKGLFPDAPVGEVLEVPSAKPVSAPPKRPPQNIGELINSKVSSAVDAMGKWMTAKTQALEKALSSQDQPVVATSESGIAETQQTLGQPQEPTGNGQLEPVFPAPQNSKEQPDPTPAQGIGGGFIGKLKRGIQDALKGVQHTNAESNSSQVAEDARSTYLPPQEAKELAKVKVVTAIPARVKPNTTLRIFVESEDIVFVECPWFGKERVALRFPKHSVFLAQWQTMHAGIGAQFMHKLCNEHRYGEHTGAIVSAIEGPVQENYLAVAIHDASIANERQILVFGQALFSKMSIAETLDALNDLVAERRKKAQMAQQAASEQLLSDLHKMLHSFQELNTEQPQATSKEDIGGKIELLAQMLEKGYLTKDEYESKKAELIRRL